MSRPLPSLTVPSIPDPLAYRLSTPADRAAAAAIDPAYPTVAFIHPVCADSFLFYPQFECPELYDHYNLFCLDLPGHGASHLHHKIDFSWAKAALVLYEALVVLKVSKVHLLGCYLGCQTAMRFSLDHPEMTLSTVCVMPPVGPGPELMDIALAEWLECLIPAIKEKDAESLASLNQQAFDVFLGMRQDYPLMALTSEYRHLVNSRLHTGELDYALGVYIALISSRNEFPPTHEIIANLQNPLLIVETVGASDATGPLVDDINEERTVKGLPPLAHRVLVEEDPMVYWLTVTDPVPYRQPNHHLLPPHRLSPTHHPSPPPVRGARLPSTPRDISGFQLPSEEDAAAARAGHKTSLVDIVRSMKGSRGIDFVWDVQVQVEVTSVTYEDF